MRSQRPRSYRDAQPAAGTQRPVDGVDVAALVTDIGDSVAVLDGLGATVPRSLGGDVLALDGGSVGHGDLAGGCDL